MADIKNYINEHNWKKSKFREYCERALKSFENMNKRKKSLEERMKGVDNSNYLKPAKINPDYPNKPKEEKPKKSSDYYKKPDDGGNGGGGGDDKRYGKPIYGEDNPYKPGDK